MFTSHVAAAVNGIFFLIAMSCLAGGLLVAPRRDDGARRNAGGDGEGRDGSQIHANGAGKEIGPNGRGPRDEERRGRHHEQTEA